MNPTTVLQWHGQYRATDSTISTAATPSFLQQRRVWGRCMPVIGNMHVEKSPVNLLLEQVWQRSVAVFRHTISVIACFQRANMG